MVPASPSCKGQHCTSREAMIKEWGGGEGSGGFWTRLWHLAELSVTTIIGFLKYVAMHYSDQITRIAQSSGE